MGSRRHGNASASLIRTVHKLLAFAASGGQWIARHGEAARAPCRDRGRRSQRRLPRFDVPIAWTTTNQTRFVCHYELAPEPEGKPVRRRPQRRGQAGRFAGGKTTAVSVPGKSLPPSRRRLRSPADVAVVEFFDRDACAEDAVPLPDSHRVSPRRVRPG